jgi:hypothetical protein
MTSSSQVCDNGKGFWEKEKEALRIGKSKSP